jgi:thioesterase domain-containing protein
MPNARLQREARLLELLADPPSRVAELRLALPEARLGVEPEDVWQLCDRRPYSVQLRWSGSGVDGSFEAVFLRHGRAASPSKPSAPFEPPFGDENWGSYANNPVKAVRLRKLIPDLRRWLQERLPEYMIPSVFVLLHSFPLTPNGKIDRRALPAPERMPVRTEIVAPRTATERKLAGLWSGVLKSSRLLGVNENFFDLGGHSLNAVRLFSQIEREFQRSLALATIFEAPTIAQLAAILDSQSTKLEFSSLVAIQPKGTRPPFFAVHGVGGNVLNYRPLAKYLGDDQPFFGLQACGVDGKIAPHTRVEDMAVHYVNEIRRMQPTGPYYLGGLSFGCSVALEMAQYLRSQGEQVALLALIDGGLLRAQELLPLRTRLPRIALFQLSRLRMHAGELLGLRPAEVAGFFRRKYTTVRRRFRSMLWRAQYLQYENAGIELPASLRRVNEGASLAFRRYLPSYYAGPAVLFRSSDGPRIRFVDPDGGWGIVIRGGLEVRRVPGDHLTMTEEPNVRVLARELRATLDDAQQRAERDPHIGPSVVVRKKLHPGITQPISPANIHDASFQSDTILARHDGQKPQKIED